jgi:hypothetical protein
VFPKIVQDNKIIYPIDKGVFCRNIYRSPVMGIPFQVNDYNIDGIDSKIPENLSLYFLK